MADIPEPNPLKLLGRVARGFTRIVDGGLRELGLAAGQLPVLVSLKKSKALSQAELARIAQVEQPSMAQLLARMERDGLVERVDDPQDKRSRLISLTPLAAKRLPKAKLLMDAHVEQALTGFSPEEIEQLTALLLRVDANVERMGGG
ncbi:MULTISPECIES: MarR family winged helix-turn-helix transcriptional regulator [Variovorax]|jgi:DNA-binding MarR family transcriptional regulator|uniref:MarR family winged helix-turn-helix transcriptional regulator n=1 Tax=Variovorax TaxID=34072 RepID=UPI000869C2CA|nr:MULTISPECIES: MarR family transcriptional regulator [Variovorax]MBN8753638.1 MarR family transcriptional regulator [Variovorax sp.]ODU17335.1 MAG: MarR family transcriptional regulator [Variovorax sp. SCN 67-85]ODV18641.1 MAG: MarR family transcriptional regulator [Variovorax sp. SCN 67-20]OJZ02715.1 MAG: MarR family transcriptional regulator [Variovorax sp. 67-131]UKI10807.1 MarR family transcriptional regulator [Variovorax paradoxus]